MLFEIDVQGARAVKEQYPDALLVFVDTPTRDEQERRLVARGDQPEKVAQRLAKGDEERVEAERIGMVTVVNDDLERAVAEVRALLSGVRASGPPVEP